VALGVVPEINHPLAVVFQLKVDIATNIFNVI
jgi:hypothetical protein